jgi:hypothetical protein
MDSNDQYGTQEDRKGVSEEGSGRVRTMLIQKKSPSLFGVGEVEQQVKIWNSRTQENRSIGYG